MNASNYGNTEIVCQSSHTLGMVAVFGTFWYYLKLLLIVFQLFPRWFCDSSQCRHVVQNGNGIQLSLGMFVFFGAGRWFGTGYENIGRRMDLSPCWRNVCVHFLSGHGELITLPLQNKHRKISHREGRNSRVFFESVSFGGARKHFFPCISNSTSCVVYKHPKRIFVWRTRSVEIIVSC